MVWRGGGSGSRSGDSEEVGGFARRQEVCLEAKISGSENAVLGVMEAMKVVGMYVDIFFPFFFFLKVLLLGAFSFFLFFLLTG